MTCSPDWLTIAWATLILCNFIVTPAWLFRLLWVSMSPTDFPEGLYATLCGLCLGVSGAILGDSTLRAMLVAAERFSGC